MQLTGILIAGGRSSRMGSDKATLSINGTTFAQHAIDLLAPLCQQLIVSYNNEPFSPHLTFVKDVHADIGPMGGLHAALLDSTGEYNLVLATDLPLLQPATLQLLVNNCQGYDITAFRNGQFAEPLCAVYHENMLELIEQHIATGSYSLQKLLNTANTHFIDLTDDMARQLWNINTPGDYNSIASLKE
jgi:molybdopterin-guanine dinucleotide biosynthesis protein A